MGRDEIRCFKIARTIRGDEFIINCNQHWRIEFLAFGTVAKSLLCVFKFYFIFNKIFVKHTYVQTTGLRVRSERYQMLIKNVHVIFVHLSTLSKLNGSIHTIPYRGRHSFEWHKATFHKVSVQISWNLKKLYALHIDTHLGCHIA